MWQHAQVLSLKKISFIFFCLAMLGRKKAALWKDLFVLALFYVWRSFSQWIFVTSSCWDLSEKRRALLSFSKTFFCVSTVRLWTSFLAGIKFDCQFWKSLCLLSISIWNFFVDNKANVWIKCHFLVGTRMIYKWIYLQLPFYWQSFITFSAI